MQAERTAPAVVGRRETPALRAFIESGRVLWLGVGLVAIFWTLAWFGPEPQRFYSFFPLWLGYIFTVDGLTYRRIGTSLLARSPAGFAGLFLLSGPFWWAFEAMNARLDNWFYRLPIDYSAPIYGFLASVAFSTVIPAVFGTAELLRTFRPFNRPIAFRPLEMRRSALLALMATGAAMLLLVILFPGQAFPLAWLSLVFIVDPFNALSGRRSLIGQVAVGRWDTVVCLFAAGITCGFFWEMWNYWSVPSWEYRVPYVGFGKIFEMPVLGYGGYLPFALEIYALWALAAAILPGDQEAMVRFDGPPEHPAPR